MHQTWDQTDLRGSFFFLEAYNPLRVCLHMHLSLVYLLTCLKHVLVMFVNCSLCLPNNICFLLHSILLDEEGHIKITGMWGTENLMSTIWYFFCSMFRASWSLLARSFLTKTQKPEKFEYWGSLLWQFVKHQCCTAHGEHNVFLVKL